MKQIEKEALASIEEKCLNEGFHLNFVNNNLFISTPVGRWMLALENRDNGIIVLKTYHGNYFGVRGDKSHHRGFSNEYHIQFDKPKSIENVVAYIINHDNKQRKNAYKKGYQSSLWKAFKKIEKELAK